MLHLTVRNLESLKLEFHWRQATVIFTDFHRHFKLDRRWRLKELSLCNKIKYLNPNIFRTRYCKPLIFQTQIIWFNRIHSLKYLRSTTLGSKDIVIRKSGFVAKTQVLCILHSQSVLNIVILNGNCF